MGCRRTAFWGICLAGFCLLAVPLLWQRRAQGSAARAFRSNPALVVSNVGTWRLVQRGVELRTATLERTDTQQVIDLKLVRMDQRWITPQILYGEELGFKTADVKTFALRSGALAAINANYFDEREKPLGLLKTNRSRTVSALSKSALFTGVFGLRDDRAFIVHRDELALEGVKEAVQAGPLLLSKGNPLTITRGAARQSRRSLVGIDTEQKLLIAVTDTFTGGLTWVELQEFFDPQLGDVRTVDLLNLDGGGSAQLYVKGPTVEEHVPGATPVPVAIGFFPRQN
jgi:uncharacterized protein YigE (DUF2233 family)